MTTTDTLSLTVGSMIDDYRQIRMHLSPTESTNASSTDFQPITGLIVPVEPNGRYLLEYFLALDVATGASGISTLADGPVNAEILMQDGATFTHGPTATDTMLITLHGFVTTAEHNGHIVLYFASLNGKSITIKAGSAARITRLNPSA